MKKKPALCEAGQTIEIGVAREISVEEALEIIRRSEAAG